MSTEAGIHIVSTPLLGYYDSSKSFTKLRRIVMPCNWRGTITVSTLNTSHGKKFDFQYVLFCLQDDTKQGIDEKTTNPRAIVDIFLINFCPFFTFLYILCFLKI